MPEISIALLDRKYRLSVTPGEEDLLQDCAKTLREKIANIREASKISVPDQLAVLAGLEVVYDSRKALENEQKLKTVVDEQQQRIAELEAKIAELEQRLPQPGESMEDKNAEMLAREIDEISKRCTQAIMSTCGHGSLFEP